MSDYLTTSKEDFIRVSDAIRCPFSSDGEFVVGPWEYMTVEELTERYPPLPYKSEGKCQP